MRNATIVSLIAVVCLLVIPSFAEIKFKDVPADHWAAKSVYDLVRLGITSGYPDGTFRGTRTISRYETAIFLSKLAEKMGAGDAAKIKEDLRSIKDDIAALKRSGGPVRLSGAVEMNAMLANIVAVNGVSGRGPVVDYRLISSLEKDIGESATVKVGLDTMDSGYYGGTRDLTKQMLDLEGDIKMNPVDLGVAGDIFNAPVDIKFTAGPGVVQHTDATGFLSSESGVCYIRPNTGLSVSSKIGEVSLTGKYLVKSYDPSDSGKVDTNYGSLSAGYVIDRLPLLDSLYTELSAGFYSKNPNSGGPRDQKWALSVSAEVNSKFAITGGLAVGRPENKTWMAKLGMEVRNLVEGSRFSLKISKIGSEFVPAELLAEEIGETGYDAFMRPLENATVNLDYDLSQSVSDKLVLGSHGTVRLSPDLGFGPDKAQSLYTLQLGFSYLPASDAAIDVFYRVHKDVPAEETTDLVGMSVRFKY
ncbi:MAG TPA: S-layer homology domain-containing protein [Candidatus Omnitrophota bacterium]|nr:S-layer homology domain-containing protein [Candidatus Omnitrophota bacterium]